ncbi:hypothetical protein K432DRAFT_455361 [Lepidopterella palustris CBS 459.81]|uniref:Uncharacterized protein n=1 Tax=Lepidopterella palustris CBS 459.81 TaxID=1314670 RepID=A0A8E2E976_9PEZI|nr:hypothetical protein K432DRAFT_455361 [Lepidopterella palustris CBS 459.81]
MIQDPDAQSQATTWNYKYQQVEYSPAEMRITIKPTPELVGRHADPKVESFDALFCETSKGWASLEQITDWFTGKPDKLECRRIIQLSFGDLNIVRSSTANAFAAIFGLSGIRKSSVVIPYRNGFVNVILRAFQQDFHLILRPDDMWLSILTQFSMYVNGHAEELRSIFVACEGKERLTIDIHLHSPR